MSWHSDKERFNEYDPPWCKNCNGGKTAEECRKCSEAYEKEREGEE